MEIKTNFELYCFEMQMPSIFVWKNMSLWSKKRFLNILKTLDVFGGDK